jgi:hypothetical protein
MLIGEKVMMRSFKLCSLLEKAESFSWVARELGFNSYVREESFDAKLCLINGRSNDHPLTVKYLISTNKCIEWKRLRGTAETVNPPALPSVVQIHYPPQVRSLNRVS